MDYERPFTSLKKQIEYERSIIEKELNTQNKKNNIYNIYLYIK